MAYLQRKQLAQYVEGWACYLAPEHPADITATNQAAVQAHAAAVTTWQVSYDNWRIEDNMSMGIIKGTLCGQYLTYVLHCTTLKAV